MSSVKALLSGYFGFSNAGDEAILSAMIETLSREIPGIEITALSGNPAETEAVHGIRAVPRAQLSVLIREIRKTNILISGGGSLLQDVTGFTSLLYYLGIILLGRILRRKVFIYAQGIGPLKRKSSRLITKLVLSGISGITVRDAESKKLLESTGVSKPEIIVTADPVFAIEPAPSERIDEILKSEDVPLEPRIGIAIREWHDAPYLGITVAKSVDTICKETGANVVFIPLQYPRDLEFAENICIDMKVNARVLHGQYTPREIMGIIGRMDLIIGMRLHALIFAGLSGVPVVGITYDPKVTALLSAFGVPPAGNAEELTTEELITATVETWKKRETASKSILEKICPLKELAIENARLIKRVLQ